MAGLGSLTIDLAANITRFERSLNRAERLADKRAKGITRTFKRMATGIGIAIASFGFVRAIDSSLDFADSIGKAADRAGIATTKLQELRFAADQFGISTQQLDDGMRRFTRRLGVALDGGSFAKDFDQLGVAIRDLNGNIRQSGDVFDDVVKQMGNLESAAQKSKVAAQLFGDDTGPQLALLMGQGEEAIKGFADQANRLGLIMSEDLIRGAEVANDELSILTQVLKIQLTEAIVALAPQIKAMATGLIELTGSVAKFFGGVNALNADEVIGEIDKISERLVDARASLAESEAAEGKGFFDKSIADVFLPSPEVVRERIADLEGQMLELQSRLGAINLAASTAGDEQTNVFTGKTPSQMAADFESAINWAQDLSDAITEEELIRRNAAIESAKIIDSARLNTFRLGIGLAQALAGKSKAAAIASIAITKGLAIAEATVQNEVAAVAAGKSAAIAAPPSPGGGAAIAAYNAAYGTVKGLGAAQIGLIAATGLAQVANLGGGAGGGGGATAGSAANPIFTQPIGADPFTQQTGTQGTITINVNGVVTEEILNDLMIPAIQSAVNDQDIILIRSDSRQAFELEA